VRLIRQEALRGQLRRLLSKTGHSHRSCDNRDQIKKFGY
jgi:hypothetical protein